MYTANITPVTSISKYSNLAPPLVPPPEKGAQLAVARTGPDHLHRSETTVKIHDIALLLSDYYDNLFDSFCTPRVPGAEVTHSPRDKHSATK